MTADFADIAIVDLDLAKTTWSRVHASMRTLYLRLSREPDLAWVRFFHEERESRVVVRRHGLWIEDGYIVFDCRLEDMQTYHLPDFRQSIEYANEKSRELARAQHEERRQQAEDAQAEWRQLAALRAQIRSEARTEAAAPAEAAPVPAATSPEPVVSAEALNVDVSAADVADAAAPPPVAPPPPAATIEELEAKRNELRARLRRALEHRIKESARGND